jgi:hypothetical protein
MWRLRRGKIRPPDSPINSTKRERVSDKPKPRFPPCRPSVPAQGQQLAAVCPPGGVATIPSTITIQETVVYIHTQRAEGEPHLAHYVFLKKVPLVLGGDAGESSGIYYDSMKRVPPLYSFTKRGLRSGRMRGWPLDTMAGMFAWGVHQPNSTRRTLRAILASGGQTHGARLDP